MKTALQLVTEERERQQSIGWDIQHDAQHTNQELPKAAFCYALPNIVPHSMWPFSNEFPRYSIYPTKEEEIKRLTKAAALLLAEIDRLQLA